MVASMSLKIPDEDNVEMAKLIKKRSDESLRMSKVGMRVSYPQCLRLMAISKEVIRCSIRPIVHRGIDQNIILQKFRESLCGC